VACLFVLPVLSVLNVAAHWHTPRRGQAVLAGLFGIGLVLAHVLFVNVAFYRYLHPLPFFVLLNGLAAFGYDRDAFALVKRKSVSLRAPAGHLR
jgi:phosphoglycerol transferase MdoB-like AlkP superfamily enzyme